MANYAILKAAISAVIRENGNNEITGNLLQQQLLTIINSLGSGYQYVGIATPDTNPGTPDQNVFYLASTAGTYANFGGLVLADGEIAILKYNGAWSKDSTGAASLEKLNQLGQEVLIKENSNEGFDGYNWNLPNYYIGIDGNIYFFDSRVIATSFIKVTPGEKFIYKGSTGSSSIAVAGYSSPNYNDFIQSILGPDISYSEIGIEIEIPSGINYICCCSMSNVNYSLQSIFGEQLTKLINNAEDIYKAIYKIDNKSFDWISGYYIKLDGTIENLSITTMVPLIAVSPGDKFYYKGINGNTSIAVAGYSSNDYSSFIEALITYGDFSEGIIVEIPNNVNYIAVCSLIDDVDYQLTRIGGLQNQVNDLNSRVKLLEEESVNKKETILNTDKIPNIKAKITNNIVNNSGILNLAFYGDSWTMGLYTPMVDYTKEVAYTLWEKYGFGGHGWWDFSYAEQEIKGVQDEMFDFVRSGSKIDTGMSSGALGFNMAHTRFNTGASITLSLKEQYRTNYPISSGKIYFYGGASFTISIDGTQIATVTGNSSLTWQNYSINQNFNTLVITSTADNSIIFGIDLSYNTSKGIKIHKLGCRGLRSPIVVNSDANNWKEGISNLQIDYFSLMLGTNDGHHNVTVDDYKNNIKTILTWIKTAKPLVDVGIMCPSLNLADWPVVQYEQPLREISLEEEIPFISLIPIFGTKNQITENQTFRDSLHPSVLGGRMIAQHLYKWLFS